MIVAQNILEILDRSHLDGAVLRLPPGQLDRPVYVAVNKVIEAAGGKWDKKAKGHKFDCAAADAIEPILLTGAVTNAKQEFGAFFTPAPLAKRVVEMAAIAPGHRILEPSAGIGHLLREMPGDTSRQAIEINAAFVEKLHPFAAVRCADFLNCNGELGLFDKIVMNPPFAKQADIRHVLHAAKFLKPGGRLVSIMSASVQFRTDARSDEFRAFVAERSGNIEALPADSFKTSGTGVNAVVVTIAG